MDPQERLFLQACWEVLEDAGYTRRHLASVMAAGSGSLSGSPRRDLSCTAPSCGGRASSVPAHTSFSSVANRVSYLFNLHGPSMPIDTMCSASLTAIHEACEHLLREAMRAGDRRRREPVSASDRTTSGFAQAGCCRGMVSAGALAQGGDGFVPGEGVGAVLLKPLAKAEADGDHIYGVIKGTAINHGGKTNGYTVPNPQAQARGDCAGAESRRLTRARSATSRRTARGRRWAIRSRSRG